MKNREKEKLEGWCKDNLQPRKSLNKHVSAAVITSLANYELDTNCSVADMVETMLKDGYEVYTSSRSGIIYFNAKRRKP